MSDCCTPRGYRWLFSQRRADVDARRYRKRGLDRTSRRILELLVARGVAGRTVLEVGGGIGALQVELLRAGASHATSVELTPTYEAAAAALLRERGLTGRVEREVADFTEIADGLAPADIVVLNRVICCYPDAPTLAGAAAEHTRGTLVLSFPKVRWWTRFLLGAANAALRLFRREFQVFLHRPAGIRSTAERCGLSPLLDEAGRFWQVMAFEASRAGPATGLEDRA